MTAHPFPLPDLSPCAACTHAHDHHVGCRVHEGCCGADDCGCMGFEPPACNRALAVPCTARGGLPCAGCDEEAASFRATATTPRREEWVEAFETWLGLPEEISGALFDRLHEPPARYRLTAIAMLEPHLEGENLRIAVQAAMYARDEMP
jgi:hypothetical protein